MTNPPPKKQKAKVKAYERQVPYRCSSCNDVIHDHHHIIRVIKQDEGYFVGNGVFEDVSSAVEAVDLATKIIEEREAKNSKNSA